MDGKDSSLNLMTVNAKQAVGLIKFRFKTMPPGNLLFIGKAGVGKTSVILQAARELGIGVKTTLISDLDRTELSGMPRLVQRQDPGYELTESDRYTVKNIPPDKLPNMSQVMHAASVYFRLKLTKKYAEQLKQGLKTEADIAKEAKDMSFKYYYGQINKNLVNGDYSKYVIPMDDPDIAPEAKRILFGIMFFDEVTSASDELQISVSGFLDGNKRGTGVDTVDYSGYVLPPGWMVVCAGNGPDDGGLWNGLPSMFLSRAMSYRFELDVNTWLRWAYENGVHPVVAAYIKAYGADALWTLNENAEYSEQFPSPRAWMQVSAELFRREESLANGVDGGYDIKEFNGESDAFIVQIIVAGPVGDKAAQQFATFWKYQSELLDMDKIESGVISGAQDYSRNMPLGYLQGSMVAARLVNRLKSYFDATNEAEKAKHEKYVITLLEWIGLFASTNTVDMGVELVAEAFGAGKVKSPFPLGTVGQYIVLHAANISTLAPNFWKFYTEHNKTLMMLN